MAYFMHTPSRPLEQGTYDIDYFGSARVGKFPFMNGFFFFLRWALSISLFLFYYFFICQDVSCK